MLIWNMLNTSILKKLLNFIYEMKIIQTIIVAIDDNR